MTKKIPNNMHHMEEACSNSEGEILHIYVINTVQSSKKKKKMVVKLRLAATLRAKEQQANTVSMNVVDYRDFPHAVQGKKITFQLN